MKTLVTLCFMALLGLVLAQDDRGPCGCTRSFDFCADDLNTYHSICEYKCKNPSTPFQEWYILYHEPCRGQPAHKVALVGRVLTQDGRGPCGCEISFDFCANDLNTYRSICEYKCKNPSTPFKEWYVLHHGPCRGQQIEAGIDTTTTRPSEDSSKDLCVKSNKSHEGYECEPRTGSCYKFHRLAKTWRKALATCHAEGGYLAIINSQTESTVLKEIYDKNPAETLIGSESYVYAAIGFYRYDEVWVTVNGDTLAEAGFEGWAPNEPNNYEGAESCGSISHDGQLNDIDGKLKHAFVCEITPK